MYFLLPSLFLYAFTLFLCVVSLLMVACLFCSNDCLPSRKQTQWGWHQVRYEMYSAWPRYCIHSGHKLHVYILACCSTVSLNVWHTMWPGLDRINPESYSNKLHVNCQSLVVFADTRHLKNFRPLSGHSFYHLLTFMGSLLHSDWHRMMGVEITSLGGGAWCHLGGKVIVANRQKLM